MGNSRKINLDPSEMAAQIAEEEYLRSGDNQPAFVSLHGLLEGMRRAKTTPKRHILLASMHVDVASYPDLDKAVISYHMAEAERYAHTVASHDLLQTVSLDSYRFALKGRIMESFLPLYRQKLIEGLDPTEDDQAELLDKLLQIGGVTFTPANITPKNQNMAAAVSAIRGAQFELGIHVLNLRHNLSTGAQRYMWPSLPRQDSPHTYDFELREGVDAFMSEAGMLAPSPTPVQFKAVGEIKDYHPDIVAIVGKDDLGTRFSGEIILNAYKEAHPSSPQEKQDAAEWLDATESKLIAKLQKPTHKPVLHV